MALKRGIVKLENYQNNWVKEYEEEAKTIQKLLGSGVLEIHHIGSTSIPGLEAKPIIDMLLVIKNFDEIDEIDEILNPYAYENRGMQGVSDRYFLLKVQMMLELIIYILQHHLVILIIIKFILKSIY